MFTVQSARNATSPRSTLARVVCLLAVAALAGCTTDTHNQPSASVGIARLALSGTSSSGVQYRLRNGNIAITGTQSTQVSSETDLNAPTIALELPIGGYLALLQDGWSLEKLGVGAWDPVRAQLTSTNPQPFTVTEQATTDVLLVFRAGDDIIEMGHGRVRISLQINDEVQQDCTTACAQASSLPCFTTLGCQDICENLAALVPPECAPVASAYMLCAAGQPGSSYVCSEGNPVAGSCLAELDLAINCATPCVDADADGFCQADDCDDADPAQGGRTDELCGDGIDQNCNGVVDEGCTAAWTCLAQFYGDGDCDCGCGVRDVDCESGDATACDYCNDLGSCSVVASDCPGSINPVDNSQCLMPGQRR